MYYKISVQILSGNCLTIHFSYIISIYNAL